MRHHGPDGNGGVSRLLQGHIQHILPRSPPHPRPEQLQCSDTHTQAGSTGRHKQGHVSLLPDAGNAAGAEQHAAVVLLVMRAACEPLLLLPLLPLLHLLHLLLVLLLQRTLQPSADSLVQ